MEKSQQTNRLVSLLHPLCSGWLIDFRSLLRWHFYITKKLSVLLQCCNLCSFFAVFLLASSNFCFPEVPSPNCKHTCTPWVLAWVFSVCLCYERWPKAIQNNIGFSVNISFNKNSTLIFEYLKYRSPKCF